jgi:hypothetical protein
MIIMIRDVELMAGCFLFLWEFIGFLYFLDCPPRILCDIMWRSQKEPPISNSTIGNIACYLKNCKSHRVFQEQAVLQPDLRKTCGTVAAKPTSRNHLWERVTPSPAPENHLQVRVTPWPAPESILISRCGW